MKYLKKFPKDADYQAFINGGGGGNSLIYNKLHKKGGKS